jgi:predicted ArsR family transcriptional regulator
VKGREQRGPLTEDVVREARALGDPTRFAIFQYLLDAEGSIGVRELTDHFGLNHNAIRQHLAKLRDAGLVLEEQAPSRGRGRPALRYRPMPGAVGRWGPVTPYEELSTLLVRVIQGEAVPDVGLAYGRALAGRASREPFEALEEVARRLGFEPRWVARRTGRELVLDRCPFASVASAAPEIVCELHRWLAQGVALESSRGDVHVSNLVIRPPHRAGCRIQLTGSSAQHDGSRVGDPAPAS